MAELHPNQIAFEAGDTYKAHLVDVPQNRELISAIADAADTIDAAAGQIAKQQDVALANDVKANMERGRQTVELGDSVNGDYSALKRDALDYYQKSFEGYSDAAIKRYMASHSDEFSIYETGIEEVVARRSIASADIRIKNELPKFASEVALGTMSWTDALAAVQVLGGPYMTADRMAAYTFALRSDVDRYQINSYLSGDINDANKAFEMLKDPNNFETLTATERARYKEEAQNRINKILEGSIEKSKDKDETFNIIQDGILNGATKQRDLRNADYLTALKRDLEDIAVKGYFEYKDMYGETHRLAYTDLTPVQWGKIRDEVDKIKLHSLNQKEADTNFKVNAENIISRVEQGAASSKISDIADAIRLASNDKAIDVLDDSRYTTIKRDTAEFVNNLAASVRSYEDITTPVKKSTAFWGAFETTTQSPWESANILQSEAIPGYREIMSNSENFRKVISAEANASGGEIYADDLWSGKLIRDLIANPEFAEEKFPQTYSYIKKFQKNYRLDAEQITRVLTGEFGKEVKSMQMQTMQDLTARSRDVIFNGKVAPKIGNNTRAEYMLSIASLICAKQDIGEYGNTLGIPFDITKEQVMQQFILASDTLARTRRWDEVSTKENRVEDANTMMAAFGLDRDRMTKEQIAAWDDLAYSAALAQSNRLSKIGRWLETPSPNRYTNKQDMYIDATWSNKKGGK